MNEPLAQTVPGVATEPLGSGPNGIRRSGPQRPGELLRALSRARRTAALYDANHPMVKQTFDEVRQLIEQFLATHSSLRLFIHEDTFFLENTVLLEESLQLYSLLVDLKEREIGTIEIHTGLESWELGRFVEILNLRAAEVKRLGGATAHLEQHEVHHITVGRLQALPPAQKTNLKVDSGDAYRAGLRVVDELNFQASRGLPLELRKARLVVTWLIDIVTHDKVALMAMSALKNYDEDTCHHSVNVSILSLLVGYKLQFDRTVMATLGLGALLHDIGKVRIPRDILGRPGPLTSGEQEIIRRHTLYGARMLRDLPHPARLAMVIAFEHHANYDLSGYPRITVKKSPHLLTRVVQLADFFDASTAARRVHQRAMLPSEAMKFILDGAGKTFDPVLARAFVEVLGLHPVGSLVELDTGDLAVVVRPAEHDVSRPAVKVFRNKTGEAIAPYRVSLDGEPERRIVRALDPFELGVDVTAYL